MNSDYVMPGVHRWGWASAVHEDGKQLIAVSPLRRSRFANAVSRLMYRTQTWLLVAGAFVAVGGASSLLAFLASGLPGIFIAALPLTAVATALMYVVTITIGDDELRVAVDGGAEGSDLCVAAGRSSTETWTDELHSQVFIEAIRLKNARTAHSLVSNHIDPRKDQ